MSITYSYFLLRTKKDKDNSDRLAEAADSEYNKSFIGIR